jgi:hypothetical protein
MIGVRMPPLDVLLCAPHRPTRPILPGRNEGTSNGISRQTTQDHDG